MDDLLDQLSPVLLLGISQDCRQNPCSSNFITVRKQWSMPRRNVCRLRAEIDMSVPGLSSSSTVPLMALHLPSHDCSGMVSTHVFSEPGRV